MISSWFPSHARVILRLVVPTLAAAALAGAEPVPGPIPSDEVARANVLIASGHRDEAIALLELRVRDAPTDMLARQILLSARIAALEDEIRNILSIEAKNKELVIGDADYEASRSRTDRAVVKRLDIAEYYAQNNRYPEAVMTCNAILKDYPHHQAALKLKFRVLQTMIEKERAELDKERALRHEDAINDVIDDGLLPGRLPKAKREIFVFDEDIAEAEHHAIQLKLQQRVDLIYDGTNGTKSTQVREVLQPLFAIAGINYVILDSALGTETLTIHLVHETIETALSTLSKLVNIRYNYSGGTVFISSATSDVLVTEIIRVQSGLTDVLTEPKFQDMQGAGGGGAGGAGGAAGQPTPNGVAGAAGAQRPGGQAGANANANANNQPMVSDLERFLDKIPDIVVGWPADGKIYFDKKSNTIYIRSTPATISEVKRLIHALDYDSAQVLIEARFIEISDSAAEELGIDWTGGAASGNTTISGATPGLGPVPATDTGASLLTSGNAVSGLAGSPSTSGLFAQVLVAPSDFMKFKAQISALESKGKADTLSEPKILTLNNAVGIIEVQQDIAYISSYENIGGSTNYSQPTNTNNQLVNPAYIQTAQIVPVFTKDFQGINLRIRPSVARNSDIITLMVSPTVREMTQPPQSISFNNSNGNTTGQPITNTIQSPPEFDTRRLVTALHIKNGGTVVLGGLSKESEAANTAGMPFLSKLPVLGSLFRRDSKLSTRSHLVIFVTAHIVNPAGAEQGEEIKRLRDTARVLLPAEIEDAVQRQKAEEAAPLPPAANDAEQPTDPVWRRDHRR
jgi:type II secretory pathway component GspD/PulD (secretin)